MSDNEYDFHRLSLEAQVLELEDLLNHEEIELPAEDREAYEERMKSLKEELSKFSADI